MKRFFNDYLKEFVYGALDGTVTTFAIIAGSAGANLDSAIVLILGVSNVLADGFSMASSNYLSEKSEREQSGEPVAEVSVKSFHNAFATFISFVLIGSIPLLPYILNLVSGIWAGNTFFVSCIFTSAAFILVGQIRGKITNKSKSFAAFETLAIGGIAATVAYGVGAFLEKVV